MVICRMGYSFHYSTHIYIISDISFLNEQELIEQELNRQALKPLVTLKPMKPLILSIPLDDSTPSFDFS